MIAYFIGGSWDLTKRSIRECLPFYEVAVAPDMSLAYPTSGDDAGPFSMRRERYVRARHSHMPDFAIYVFESTR